MSGGTINIAALWRRLQPMNNNVSLQPITRDNFRDCVRLKVAAEQEHFVASNAISIAQTYAWKQCVPLAIYDGDTIVGFAMYARNEDEPGYSIWRLMVDQRFQGRGFGRAAMRLLIDRLRAEPDCTNIAISYEPHNDVARKLYASLGFVETGEVDDGETVARLRFT